MNSKKYTVQLIIVSLSILGTICGQVYWNFVNYKSNKADLDVQLQQMLNNSIEQYYGNITRDHSFSFSASFNDTLHDIGAIEAMIDGSIGDSSHFERVMHFSTDSFIEEPVKMLGIKKEHWKGSSNSIQVISHDTESIDPEELSDFVSKIIISMGDENIDLEQLGASMQKRFEENEWSIQFGLEYQEGRLPILSDMDREALAFGVVREDGQLTTKANSAFLPGDAQLTLYYSNVSGIVLGKSMMGIVLSFALTGLVIYCLLILVRTIKRQKDIAEIKNDLISNITHEFKTPITTIGTALEAIQSFGGESNSERTTKYLKISEDQLGKLNGMVEKILETSTLDSDELRMKLEEISVVRMVEQQIQKFSLSFPDHHLNFDVIGEEKNMMLDPFHFDGVCSNIIDNAIKYGGGEVNVKIDFKPSELEILFKDSGSGITSDQKAKIFDKFYRVPKGNRHDVKGFGIGLYYSKNIVEKHKGNLVLASTNPTIFKITVPYGG